MLPNVSQIAVMGQSSGKNNTNLSFQRISFEAISQSTVPSPTLLTRCWGLRLESESSFAIRFLLEIPLRGFPSQMRLYEHKQNTLQKHTNLSCRRISFEEEIPEWGSRAGDVSQTSRPILVVLGYLIV